jgi:hypothetical protein
LKKLSAISTSLFTIFYFLFSIGFSPAASAQNEAGVTFQDVTAKSGIHFTHNNGAFGKKFLPETVGPGVAFIDYDNDGWPDIFLVNGSDWPGHLQKHSTPKLYRNNHDGTFTDVTHKARLDIEMYGIGVAVGDYDNDGFDDLFITAYGQSRLFHNNGPDKEGNVTFTDATQKAGLNGIKEFSTSAAWVDYDKDGRLDLVVGNYVQWSPENDLYCTLDGKSKSYCTPESYKGSSVRLWHNNGKSSAGNVTFSDVTQKSGLGEPTSKTLGVAVLDYDNDGWPDLLFSNDTQPNKLYHNNSNGTFTEKAVVAGVAFSEDGVARAGMGVDTADYDRTGNTSLIITNFSNQMISLYHNEGKGLFVDEAPRSDVGRASLLTLGFGCFFFDYDLDGWPDILVTNGHIDPDIQKVQVNVKFAEPPHLFRNLGEGKFAEVTKSAGAEFAAARVGRSAAYADVFNDGRLDILLSTNGGAVHLFRNVAAKGAASAANRSVRLKLVGTQSNRDGIGAVVRVTTSDGTQTQMLKSGSSYLAANELVLTFGVGKLDKADTIEIRWPSGQVDKLSNVTVGQTVVISEGKGATKSVSYSAK